MDALDSVKDEISDNTHFIRYAIRRKSDGLYFKRNKVPAYKHESDWSIHPHVWIMKGFAVKKIMELYDEDVELVTFELHEVEW